MFGLQYLLRPVNDVLCQHQRQDVRNMLQVARAITTIIGNCQAREPDNLPRDDRRSSHALILLYSVRLSITSFVGNNDSGGAGKSISIHAYDVPSAQAFESFPLGLRSIQHLPGELFKSIRCWFCRA